MTGTVCPFCGAYSVRSCEFEGGEEGCPWDDLNNEPDLDPDYLREIRDENKRLQKDDDAFLSTLGGTNGQ